MRTALATGLAIPQVSVMINADKLVQDGRAGVDAMAVDQFKLHVIAACAKANTTTGSTIEDAVKSYFKDFEREYKLATKEPKMPGHYRSNKSVVSQCIGLGIEILDDTGHPRGKTELQQAINATKMDSNPLTVALNHLNAVEKKLSEFSGPDRAAIKLAVQKLREQLA